MSKKPTIAVIGCGGIGSRHIQALARLRTEASVYAVDISKEATEQAEKIFSETKAQVASTAGFIRVHEFSELPKEIDVVIVATRAASRLAAIKAVLSGRSVTHLILEKFLFSRRNDFLEAKQIFSEQQISVWVNCPRRIYPGYKFVRQKLENAQFIRIHVSGSARITPIGTIGIHFADLLDFLAVSRLSDGCASLRTAGTVPANRNLRDFSGIFEMSSLDGRSHLLYEALENTEAPHLVSIFSDRFQFVIRERDQEMQVSSAETGWKCTTQGFDVPFQSALTNIVVQELLDTGSCGLTPFSNSAAIHLKVFDSLITAFRSIENDPYIEELPFT